MSSQCSYRLRLTIVFLYLILFSIHDQSVFGQVKKCGEALTDALAGLCKHRFNKRFRRNSEMANENLFYRLQNIIKKVELVDDTLMRKRRQDYSVNTKGVADECCTDACIFADIVKYCN